MHVDNNRTRVTFLFTIRYIIDKNHPKINKWLFRIDSLKEKGVLAIISIPELKSIILIEVVCHREPEGAKPLWDFWFPYGECSPVV